MPGKAGFENNLRILRIEPDVIGKFRSADLAEFITEMGKNSSANKMFPGLIFYFFPVANISKSIRERNKHFPVDRHHVEPVPEPICFGFFPGRQ